MVASCSNFTALKKIDKSLNIKSSYKNVKCPYCDKMHIDKLGREALSDDFFDEEDEEDV